MANKALKYDQRELSFTGIIGTGGIGSGKFFVLNGDHTLGREESRSGHFLNVNDYCKQHIILHYIKVLLGSSFRVIPVGKIGDDDIGQVLFNEMKETAFEMQRIEQVPHVSTLFSFCFYYPDSSGGNLTTDNSASAKVDAAFIEKAGAEIQKLGSKGIIMAAPEVPLEARQKLLEMGKQNGLFCTASFTTEEIRDAMDRGMMAYTDLIAINIDEAAAVTGSNVAETDSESIVRTAVENLKALNRNIMVSVTNGRNGSWCWDGNKLNSFPSVKTEAVSTAGAGDAFFSGIICGLALGLHLFEAQQLASLVAGLSVTSIHTINKGVDRQALKNFFKTSDLNFSEKIVKLLED
jgi:ribokinase